MLRSLAGLLLVVCGCATVARLEPVDLAAPGWKVRPGQAVWRAKEGAPEMAGEFLLAHGSDGSLLQFSKPLPIVNARLEGNQWEIEFPPENRRYSGRGNPPKKISWFQLMRGFEGRELPEEWVFSRGEQVAVLEHTRTGERIEVHFQP